MADESSYTLRSINWRELFPFTNLFRAFRVAVHPSKLVIALLGLLLIYSGGRVMDGIWNEKYKAHGNLVTYDVREHGDPVGRHLTFAKDEGEVSAFWNDVPKERMSVKPAVGVFDYFFRYEILQAQTALTSSMNLDWNAASHAIWNFMVSGPVWLWGWHWFFALLFTAWFLLIWSTFGGAVARIAAVHVARDEKISVRQAMRFSIGKVLSFLFAPLIPLIIILVLGIILAAVSWLLLHIPVLGPIVAGLLLILAIIGGFVMALVLVGTLGGFNLMYPTVAVEGSDSFDAISRSFSYVFARPWRMLWYTAVALVYGAITFLFVKFFIFLALSLTHFFMSWWLSKSGQPGTYFPYMWPAPEFTDLAYSPDFAHLKGSDSFAAGLMAFWVYLTISLLGAYAISYYFSANTIIYFLMRREVDATELDDVYLEDADDEFGESTAMRAEDDAVGNPAPAIGTTSAPGGGVLGSAGSADPGGSPTGGAQPYSSATTENPPPTGT